MSRFGQRETPFSQAFRSWKGSDPRIFFLCCAIFLEFPGFLNDFGKTTWPRSLQKLAAMSISISPCAGTGSWPHAATIDVRRESADRIACAGQALWPKSHAFSGLRKRYPETMNFENRWNVHLYLIMCRELIDSACGIDRGWS
jgi:hypothetical protein